MSSLHERLFLKKLSYHKILLLTKQIEFNILNCLHRFWSIGLKTRFMLTINETDSDDSA